MRILTQLGIIFTIWYIAQFVSHVLAPLIVVPASVVGMILMLAALWFRIIKIEQVKEVSDFLLENIAFFFVPAGVGILHAMEILKVSWLQIVAINLVSTLIVLVVSAATASFFLRSGGGDDV